VPHPRAASAFRATSLVAAAVASVVVTQTAQAAERVGSETCRACHESAYRLWKASPHAKAAENLAPAQRADLRCAYCHAPEQARAVQEQASFQRADQVASQQPGEVEAQIEGGFGCETCHGAGQYYSPSYVMRDSELSHAVGLLDPGQKSCLVCHSAEAPSLTPFDFAAKVKLIDHWSQERSHERSKASAATAPSGPPPSDARSDSSPASASVPPTKVASP
jgi:hypothetical protein